ncbi:hypothetical protein KBA27_05980 [bacterium]|nr:hypothetical protein [bacterium]
MSFGYGYDLASCPGYYPQNYSCYSSYQNYGGNAGFADYGNCSNFSNYSNYGNGYNPASSQWGIQNTNNFGINGDISPFLRTVEPDDSTAKMATCIGTAALLGGVAVLGGKSKSSQTAQPTTNPNVGGKPNTPNSPSGNGGTTTPNKPQPSPVVGNVTPQQTTQKVNVPHGPSTAGKVASQPVKPQGIINLPSITAQTGSTQAQQQTQTTKNGFYQAPQTSSQKRGGVEAPKALGVADISNTLPARTQKTTLKHLSEILLKGADIEDAIVISEQKAPLGLGVADKNISTLPAIYQKQTLKPLGEILGKHQTYNVQGTPKFLEVLPQAKASETAEGKDLLGRIVKGLKNSKFADIFSVIAKK